MTWSRPALMASAMVVLLFPVGFRLTLAQRTSISRDQYAGAEVCAECHRGESTQFHKTNHAKAQRNESLASTGCEACHGPGKAHVDAMKGAQGDDQKILAGMKLIFAFNASPAENSARCITCHARTHEQSLFDRSEHKLHGVACQTCHAPHLTGIASRENLQMVRAQTQFVRPTSKPAEVQWLNNKLLREAEPALCFTCHKTIEAQFALPNRHKVSEGLMKCTDCHNPHGTRNTPMLKKTNWEACIACHTEKRGPFVFEHASVKVEGCITCHSPHGSVNRMMLVRREGRFLCLQCHVDPQADNVPHGRLGFQTRGDCVRCHATIHGSNFSEVFLN